MNESDNKFDEKGTNMYGNTAHNIYAQNDIGIESPAKLIAMLYEGVLRFNAQAKKSIKDENIEKQAYWINRSIAVITELVSTIDMSQGEISEYLQGLYSYQVRLLTSASFEDNIDKIDESSNVFRTLLEAWKESNGLA